MSTNKDNNRFSIPKLSFGITGKIESTTALEKAVELLKHLPGIDVRFWKLSEFYLYLVDRKTAERCGAIRKRRGPEP